MEEITTLGAFMAHMERFKEDLEGQYGRRIKNLEDRNAELAIFVSWGWALAKECKHYHSRQICGKTGGTCRPGACPMIEI